MWSLQTVLFVESIDSRALELTDSREYGVYRLLSMWSLQTPEYVETMDSRVCGLYRL